MRLLSVLMVLALFMGWPPCGRAAANDSPDDTSVTADRGPAIPLGWLWPGGLLVGYISVDLKRQLQRRGHLSGDRRETFSDLISVDRPAPRRSGPQSSDEGRAAPPRH